MKTNSKDDGTHNLVMFPSSKNFRIDLQALPSGPDPLDELINEYSHLRDDQIPKHLDDRFEIELEENFHLQFEDELDGDSYHSLEAFMNRNQRGESLTPDDKLVRLINERLQAIKDAKERIKFYLDEIEMFLPSRKK